MFASSREHCIINPFACTQLNPEKLHSQSGPIITSNDICKSSNVTARGTEVFEWALLRIFLISNLLLIPQICRPKAFALQSIVFCHSSYEKFMRLIWMEYADTPVQFKDVTDLFLDCYTILTDASFSILLFLINVASMLELLLIYVAARLLLFWETLFASYVDTLSSLHGSG